MDLFADYQQENGHEHKGSYEPKVEIRPWYVLLVDDDEQMHQITRLALNGFTFQGRPLDLISAMSGTEAQEKLGENDDIALALIDVVMERNMLVWN